MKIFITALALMSSSAVFAWGATGHRVVGEVAMKFLTIETLVRTRQILQGQGLAHAATWADEIRSDPEKYQYTFNWHYTTWQSDAHDHSAEAETSSTGFLLKTINEQTAVLRDPAASDEKKEFALKFIVHLVGDVHMPLHVGNGTDQGANFCKVTFMSKPYNLHALWDEGMIDFTNLSYTEIAGFISEGKTSEQVDAIKNTTVLQWAQESKNIVPTLYPADIAPSTEPMSMLSYCKKEVTAQEMPKLSYEYSYKFLPVVERRLYEAGVRLAKLLNDNLK